MTSIEISEHELDSKIGAALQQFQYEEKEAAMAELEEGQVLAAIMPAGQIRRWFIHPRWASTATIARRRDARLFRRHVSVQSYCFESERLTAPQAELQSLVSAIPPVPKDARSQIDLSGVHVPDSSDINWQHCSECSGEGELLVDVECRACVGGQVDCWPCDGRGYDEEREECPECEGVGSEGELVTCYECSGEGYIVGDCHACEGQGRVITNYPCSSCGTSRWGPGCFDCEGMGRRIEECDECDGKGGPECFDCDGDGEVDTRRECYKCDGFGEILLKPECSECDGLGTEDCETCDGTGEVEVLRDCPPCHATGKIWTAFSIAATFNVEAETTRSIASLPEKALSDIKWQEASHLRWEANDVPSQGSVEEELRDLGPGYEVSGKSSVNLTVDEMQVSLYNVESDAGFIRAIKRPDGSFWSESAPLNWARIVMVAAGAVVLLVLLAILAGP